jgi:hypothetical protein
LDKNEEKREKEKGKERVGSDADVDGARRWRE